jgi:hypothetical protein
MRNIWRLELAIALASLLVSSGAFGQSAPPKGCFCLKHVATDQFLRGCSGFKPSGSFYGRAFCTDSETGADSDVLMTEAWMVVAEGMERCAPCELQSRTTREVPRKPEDEQDEAGE